MLDSLNRRMALRRRNNMLGNSGVWSLAAAALIAVVLSAVIARVPYLPGDVAVARAIQSVTPTDTHWAQMLTATAKWPNILVLAGIVAVASWLLAGRRAALLALLSFGAMLGLDKLLRLLLFQARPSPELISVAEPGMKGSAFPSTFALLYVGTLGYLAIVSLARTKGRVGLAVALACIILLALGLAARVALGAHWPSDVLVSYLYGFVWASVLLYWIPARDEGAR
jgi:membrane-associated phospholipid phosphatase